MTVLTLTLAEHGGVRRCGTLSESSSKQVGKLVASDVACERLSHNAAGLSANIRKGKKKSFILQSFFVLLLLKVHSMIFNVLYLK